MRMKKQKLIFTIGHSTRTGKEFLDVLKSFDIEFLVDVRHYPGSRYCPQFGKDRLRKSLEKNSIHYVHLESLGGRRRPVKGATRNLGWRSLQFRGYADYMQTREFAEGLKVLISYAQESTVAIMCSEAVPWRCHRSMIGDALIAQGFDVIDIINETTARPHFLTPFAKVKRRRVSYPAES